MTWTKIKNCWQSWHDATGAEHWSWPDIVQYTDGTSIADTPDGLPDPTAGYQHVTHDLDAKEMLDRTGLIYDGRHRGVWTAFRDARSAPGA